MAGGFLKVDLGSSIEHIKQSIIEAKNIKCDLIAFNTKGKNRLRALIKKVLSSSTLLEYFDDIAGSVLELVFNAIKANYAHSITLEKIRKHMLQDFDPQKKMDIHNDPELKSLYNNLIQSKETNEKVKSMLKIEKSIFDLNYRVEKENRDFTINEISFINKKNNELLRDKDERIKITLMIVETDNRIFFDIVNDAPISESGINRIAEKRRLFRTYYDKNEVQNFYIENLDDSEGAGFGSAMIDMRLLDMGLDPYTAFTVVGINNKTSANLSIHK